MKLKYSVVAVALACAAMSNAIADEAAAKRWIDTEFQPSTLSKDAVYRRRKKTESERRQGNFCGVGNNHHPRI
jgi:hypothetical protein